MKRIPDDARADRAVTWSTSTVGSAPDTSPIELAALSDHLHRCVSAQGAWFPLQSAAETMGRWIEPRVTTIIVLFALLSILASYVI